MEFHGKGKASMMEESSSSKMKQVREALVEMGLPQETIEQALQAHGSGDDLNGIATYAQAECIEEHLSDDMNSSDEDPGLEPVVTWMQAPIIEREPLAQGAESDKEWQDPICKLFQSDQTKKQVTESCDGGVNSELQAPVQKKLELLMPVKTEESGSSDRLRKGKFIVEDHQAPEETSKLALVSNSEQREAAFKDMGFSEDLIQRAVQLHGARADDSILLQFLLDWREHRPQKPQQTDDFESDSDLSEDEINAMRISNRNTKHYKGTSDLKEQLGATDEPHWTSEENNSEESDSDDAPPSEWGAETSDFVTPATLCSREIPLNGGHRALIQSQGFAPDLVEKAILELGEGVEYDMLLEYLLYLSDKQDLQASTSNLKHDKRISTLEKLVADFQFPTPAVEKAMKLCNTPLWDATEEEFVDIVDFLAAHGTNLIEAEESVSVSESDSDESDEEGVSWTRVREEVTGKVTPDVRGKRKLDDRLVEKGRSVVPRGRPKGTTTNGLSKRGSGALIPRMVKPNPAKEKFVKNQRTGSIGFGLPGMPVKPRHLKQDVKGAPFFYFENVAGMPAGEWERIRTHLFDIEPEFVDAMHFSACRRPRGYIHNLPLEGRRKILEDPPMTIQELMPQTKPFWPVWDTRTKFNCINTMKGGEFLTKRVGIVDGTALSTEEPTVEMQKKIMHWVRKWNLVWTAPNIPSAVEAQEIEALLGFDRDHSRSCFGNTARHKALGNSFSVYTVAFHFSVLKPLYPRGVKVLSLFSGIGGAEVALHKLGIKLLVVVSVEIEKGARRCIESWWATTKQTGILDQRWHDAGHLKREILTDLVNQYEGFDLIVGGSPCNNLSGNNRYSRSGLNGDHSTAFFEYSRIVSTVRELTIRLQENR